MHNEIVFGLPVSSFDKKMIENGGVGLIKAVMYKERGEENARIYANEIVDFMDDNSEYNIKFLEITLIPFLENRRMLRELKENGVKFGVHLPHWRMYVDLAGGLVPLNDKLREGWTKKVLKRQTKIVNDYEAEYANLHIGNYTDNGYRNQEFLKERMLIKLKNNKNKMNLDEYVSLINEAYLNGLITKEKRRKLIEETANNDSYKKAVEIANEIVKTDEKSLLAIENIPRYDQRRLGICYYAEDMKNFMEKSNIQRYVLDLRHALATCNFLDLNYKKELEKFKEELGWPTAVHLSNSRYDFTEVDTHDPLNMSNGTSIKIMKELIMSVPKEKRKVVIESEKSFNKEDKIFIGKQIDYFMNI